MALDSNPLWYKNAIFYEVYVRAFFDSNNDGHGDLQGLIRKLDYLEELGVNCLWLLPIYPSPLKDDGYDIADYYGILPEYGKPDDLKGLLDAAHTRGMRVIADLVLNHTSDQHPWFQSARANQNSPYREYYVWSDTDERYQQARIIFLDTESSNWTWDEVAEQYYWHRFYASQPDLNYDNPAVRDEMFRIMCYWLDMGIDGFRADAVPYLYEREGTNCENLPETHEYLKSLRKFMDQNYPGRILLCEANQWPEDVRPYFGNGDEFHMGFHFPIMPRIYMALRMGDCTPMVEILRRTPPIPENCQWCNFLRNHDELTLEMVTEEERQWMWEQYAPDSRMRLNLGIRRRLAPLLDNDRRKIELANALMFSLPGSPIIYYGDEIGMGDDIWLPDRNGVRTPMQWREGVHAGFSAADRESLYAPVINREPYTSAQVNVFSQRHNPNSLYQFMRRLINVRKAHPVFGDHQLTWVEGLPTSIAAFWREDKNDRILVINNLSSDHHTVMVPVSNQGEMRFTGLLDQEEDSVSREGKIKVNLPAFAYRWLKQSDV